jgi:hypothetical protein
MYQNNLKYYVAHTKRNSLYYNKHFISRLEMNVDGSQKWMYTRQTMHLFFRKHLFFHKQVNSQKMILKVRKLYPGPADMTWNLINRNIARPFPWNNLGRSWLAWFPRPSDVLGLGNQATIWCILWFGFRLSTQSGRKCTSVWNNNVSPYVWYFCWTCNKLLLFISRYSEISLSRTRRDQEKSSIYPGVRHIRSSIISGLFYDDFMLLLIIRSYGNYTFKWKYMYVHVLF